MTPSLPPRAAGGCDHIAAATAWCGARTPPGPPDGSDSPRESGRDGSDSPREGGRAMGGQCCWRRRLRQRSLPSRHCANPPAQPRLVAHHRRGCRHHRPSPLPCVTAAARRGHGAAAATRRQEAFHPPATATGNWPTGAPSAAQSQPPPGQLRVVAQAVRRVVEPGGYDARRPRGRNSPIACFHS